MRVIQPDLWKHLRNAVDVMVLGGYAKQVEILASIREMVDDEAEGDKAVAEALRKRALAQLARRKAQEARWPARTTNDRIDAAFKELNRNGIVALQNAGYTTSDGWEDANEVATNLKKRPLGATFFHGQDMERGIAGKGLFLAFGAYEDDAKNDAAAIAVAREICATLARHGIKTKWNGSVDQRIHVRPFIWRKRRFTKPKLVRQKR